MHHEDIVVVAFDLARFEVQRIGRYQHQGVRPAQNLYVAAHVGEGARAARKVVMRFVGLQMLVFEVELHVTPRKRVMRGVVIFHVVRAQPHPGVLQIHVFVGDEDFSLVGLWPVGRKFRVLSLSRRKAHLLCFAWRRQQSQNRGA